MSDELKEMQELSALWIKEGREFADGLNAFLDAMYAGTEKPEEPTDERSRLVGDVLPYMAALTKVKDGEPTKLREMFPPAHEPFAPFYSRLAYYINLMMVLDDGRIVCRVSSTNERDPHGMTFLLGGKEQSIGMAEEVRAFGMSHNREFLVKVTDNKINIHKDWDGEALVSFDYPAGYGKENEEYPKREFDKDSLEITDVQVFNDGKRVLLVTQQGVFLFGDSKFECIYPSQEEIKDNLEEYYDDEFDPEEHYPFSFDLHYCHAKLSPNNKLIVLGSQMTDHLFYEFKDGKFEQTSAIESRSAYPHTVAFNEDLNHVALSSCHYSRSGTVGVDLDLLPTQSTASWNEDWDERFDYMNDNCWIFTNIAYGKGYLMGDNNGYLWHSDPKDRSFREYLHIGGTALCSAYDKDKKHLVVGTSNGYIIKFELNTQERDPALVTNMKVKEVKRWAIWQDLGWLEW